MKQIIALILISMASALMINAGCVSDCKDEFDYAVQSCKDAYDDPEDADDLEQCIQAAKGDYQACLDECKPSDYKSPPL